MKTFYLVSDSTGELGERFLQAIMSQFPKDRIALRKFNFVKDQRDIRAAFAKMTARESVLFHTVVFRRLKTLIHRIAKRRGIPQFDLTGPAAEFVIEHLGMDPVWDVEVIHARNEEYDRRVRAIEFTIEHDDGAGLKDLREADVILVGPSRSSKTPTSMYLATKGYKVANIPLIRELGENEALAGLKKDGRVRAFTIRAPELIEIRSKRAAELGYRTAGYTDPAEVGREIAWVRRVYAGNGWRTIDVTDRAIEETAALIVKSLSLSEAP